MKCAWVTYANTPDYFMGAMVLAKSLEEVKSKYNILVLVPDEFNDNINQRLPYNVVICTRPSLDCKAMCNATRAEYKACTNKLYIWTFEEYDKLCWLDSDTIVLQNIDELFDIPIEHGSIAAAPGCTCNTFNNPKMLTMPHLCPFNQHLPSCYINTGVFLIRPSILVFSELLRLDYNKALPDQDAFNEYFGARGRITLLDPKYNFMNHLEIAHKRACFSTPIHVFHFTYGKPWNNDQVHWPLTERYRVHWRSLLEQL